MSCLDIAHRGASRDALENSLEAFELAVVQGADMIETDLHLLRDGEIALFHDAEVEGVPIGRLDRAELRAMAPRIPLLEEALAAVGDRIPFNLEIKRRNGSDYVGLVPRVLQRVRERGWLDRTLFSSFYDTVLAEIRALEPAARLGLLISPRSHVSVVERAERLRAEAVHPERSLVTSELVRGLQSAGYRVHVYTVDDEADQRRLLAWGVDGIFTNVPAQLRALLAS